MKTYKTVIIGCGLMSHNHIRGYLATRRFEIVAIADFHESAMNEVDDIFSIKPRHYTDAREMLEKEKPDVVSICTWHIGHAEWTIAAAAFRPRAILCEKPMADNIGRAEQMIIACQRNNVKLAIAHQRRFLPAYSLARKFVSEGMVGDVILMTSTGGQGLPNFCTHQTDMFRYILSDDECVWAMGNIERKTDRWERSTRIEDRAEVVYQFAGGARAMILCDLTPSPLFQGAQIYGSEGMIQMSVNDLQLMNAKTGGNWKMYEPEGCFVKPDNDKFEWVEAGAAQADELANWIEGKTDNYRGDAQNGLKALHMIHAVYESARCHERVDLPIETRVNPLDLMVDSGHLSPERPGKYDIRAFLLREEAMCSDEKPL